MARVGAHLFTTIFRHQRHPYTIHVDGIWMPCFTIQGNSRRTETSHRLLLRDCLMEGPPYRRFK